MEYKLDGYCGLYCGACPIMLATRAGENSTPCYGCKSELPAGHCQDCAIKQCARFHHYEFCGECPEVQKCDKLANFIADPQWPYHQGVMKNFETIRLASREGWLIAQQQRWICPDCQQAYSWWDETCKTCGADVNNYRTDL